MAPIILYSCDSMDQNNHRDTTLLLKTQMNELVSIMESNEVPASQLEYRRGMFVYLAEEKYFFAIEEKSLLFSPADHTLSTKIDLGQNLLAVVETTDMDLTPDEIKWLIIKSQFEQWLSFLKREIEAPDLWEIARSESSLLEAKFPAELQNERFSPEEISRIAEGLHEIKEFIISNHEVTGDRLARLEGGMKYLEAALSRVGRVDWKNILVATVINLGIGLALPDDVWRQIMHMSMELLRPLLILGGPLLPR